MKKLVRRSHLLLTLKLVILMGFQWNSSKHLIPDKDDSEESSDNNSNISFDFKYFKALINRTWNSGFLISWSKSYLKRNFLLCLPKYTIFLND